MKRFSAFVILATAMTVCSAQSIKRQDVNPYTGAHFFLGFDYGKGGDTLIVANYQDGTSQSIRVGGGSQFKGGVDYRLNQNLSIRASLGYQFQTTHASDGYYKFKRWPVELMGLWRVNDNFRFGAGLTTAINPRFTSAGAGSAAGTHTFSQKISPVLEAEYLHQDNFGLYLRFVDEKMKVNGTTYKGNHVAGGLNYYY